MKKEYNRLVRDNIPSIIRKDGKKCKTKRLDDESYLNSLNNKLLEEVIDVVKIKNRLEIAEEIADVLEVLEAISKVYDVNMEEIKAIKEAKALKKGKFKKRRYIEYIIEDEHG